MTLSDTIDCSKRREIGRTSRPLSITFLSLSLFRSMSNYINRQSQQKPNILKKKKKKEKKKGKGSPHPITERRVPELIPVLGSQPAGDVNHKPDGRLPLLSARPTVNSATLKRAITNFAAW